MHSVRRVEAGGDPAQLKSKTPGRGQGVLEDTMTERIAVAPGNQALEARSPHADTGT